MCIFFIENKISYTLGYTSSVRHRHKYIHYSSNCYSMEKHIYFFNVVVHLLNNFINVVSKYIQKNREYSQFSSKVFS